MKFDVNSHKSRQNAEVTTTSSGKNRKESIPDLRRVLLFSNFEQYIGDDASCSWQSVTLVSLVKPWTMDSCKGEAKENDNRIIFFFFKKNQFLATIMGFNERTWTVQGDTDYVLKHIMHSTIVNRSKDQLIQKIYQLPWNLKSYMGNQSNCSLW